MKRILTALLLINYCFITAMTPAYAYDALGGVDCGSRGSANSAVCKEKTNKNPLVGNDGILIKIADIIAYLAGAIAIIMILVGSFRFLTAGSDLSKSGRPDDDVENARGTIVNALIGLAVIILARTIINYVVTRL